MNIALTGHNESPEQLVQSHPGQLLSQLDFKINVLELCSKKDGVSLEADHVMEIVADFRNLLLQAVWIKNILAENAVDTKKPDAELFKQDIERHQTIIQNKIVELLNMHGEKLLIAADGDYAFHHQSNYDSKLDNNDATFANFRDAELAMQKLWQQKAQRKNYFNALGRTEFGKNVPGLQSLKIELLNGHTGLSEKMGKVQGDIEAMWSSPMVRLADRKKSHLSYIRSLRSNQEIIEGPETVRLLNQIHDSIYGCQESKVASVALVGPPGVGKTKILEYYFMQHGVTAESSDIDPGQSSFTLMASPTLGLEKGMEEKQSLIEHVKQADKENLGQLLRLDPKFFAKILALDSKDLADPNLENCDEQFSQIKKNLLAYLSRDLNKDVLKIMEGIGRKGYNYALILKALQEDRPVILNEFPEIQEWTFLHSLLEAKPCSDEERSPHPKENPKFIKGWFLNTITGEWMKVGQKFRICFTGNIGREYGNSFVPPALMSRIGDSLIHIEAMPPQQVAETIAWPQLCNPDDGRFLLDDAVAYKLHFLISEVLPKMQKRLSECGLGAVPIASYRSIIDLCKSINPANKISPLDIDEALMRVFILPLKAQQQTDVLPQVVSILKGTGFLQSKEYDKRLSKENILSAADLGRLTEMIKDVTDPFKEELYKNNKDRYQEACPICGVKRCPCHGSAEKNDMDDLQATLALLKVGLSRKLMKEIGIWQKDLAEQKRWPILIESLFGNKELATRSIDFTQEQLRELTDYLQIELNKLPTKLEDLPDKLPLFVDAVNKRFIKKEDLTTIVSIESLKTLEKQLQEMIEGDEEEINSVSIERYLRCARLIKENIDATYNIPDSIKRFLQHNKNVRLNPLQLVDIAAMSRGDMEWKNKFDADLKSRKSELKNICLKECGEILNFNESDPKFSSAKKSKSKSAPAVDTKSMATPGVKLENNFIALHKILEKIGALIHLKIARIEELHPILSKIEEVMNEAVQTGRITNQQIYIRLIKALAACKNIEYADLVETLMQIKTPPLPPVRKF